MQALVQVLNLYKSDPEVIKLFPFSTQLSTKFILLKKFKMPTIVGILTFMSMINTTSERLKAIYFFSCRYFSFYEQLKFGARVEHENIFITSGPDSQTKSMISRLYKSWMKVKSGQAERL